LSPLLESWIGTRDTFLPFVLLLANLTQASSMLPMTLLDGLQVLRGHGAAVPNQFVRMGLV